MINFINFKVGYIKHISLFIVVTIMNNTKTKSDKNNKKDQQQSLKTTLTPDEKELLKESINEIKSEIKSGLEESLLNVFNEIDDQNDRIAELEYVVLYGKKFSVREIPKAPDYCYS